MKRSVVAGGALTLLLTAAAGVCAWSGLSAARDRRLRRQLGEIGELKSLWADVDGCRIHALASADPAAADRLPVVLVHGFGISSSYFIPTAERLAKQFPVYAPDLPGHGKSGTPGEPLDVPQLADSLVAWMDAVGLQCASLVGHSMGCQIVIDAAARYPSRVDRLVLVGLTPEPGARSLTELLRRSLVAGRYERWSLKLLLVMNYARMGRRLIPELRFMLADRTEDKLAHVRVPVMLVRGEKDVIADPQWYREVARRVGADGVAVIDAWGHAVNYSAARQLTDTVAPFLGPLAVSDEPANAPPTQVGRDRSGSTLSSGSWRRACS